MNEKLMFTTFEDFCLRADEILITFKKEIESNRLHLSNYKSYIYEKHTFSTDSERDMMAKDKCWNWIMSYKYEPMEKNDLFCVLSQIKKY